MTNALFAIEYLKHLQSESIFSERGGNSRSVILDALDKELKKAVAEGTMFVSFDNIESDEFKEFFDRKFESKRVIPTSNENLGYFSIMVYFDNIIVSEAQKLSYSIPENYVLGSLPTGRINATVIEADEGEYIFAFDTGIFEYVYTLSWLIGGPLAWINPTAQKPLRDIILSYVFRGKASHSVAQNYIQSVMNPVSTVTVMNLVESIMLFILGHEYGHIIRGHLDVSSSKSRMFGKESVDLVEFGWKREFEADLVGLQFVLSYFKTRRHLPLAHTIANVESFFIFFELIERTLSILMSGDESRKFRTESHPPLRLRRSVVRTMLSDLLSQEEYEPVRLCMQLKQRLTNKLWEKVKPSFEELHETRSIALVPSYMTETMSDKKHLITIDDMVMDHKYFTSIVGPQVLREVHTPDYELVIDYISKTINDPETLNKLIEKAKH